MADSAKKKPVNRQTGSKTRQKTEPDIPKKSTSKTASKASSGKPVSETRTGDAHGTGKQQGTAIVLIALAAFLFCIVFIEGESAWNWCHNTMFGVFGFCAYIIPILLAYMGIMYAKDSALRNMASNIASAGIFTVILSSLFHLVKSTPLYIKNIPLSKQISDVWAVRTQKVNGGAIGALVGGAIGKLFGRTGAIITVVILMIVALMFLTGVTLPLLATYVRRLFRALGKTADQRFEKNELRREEMRKKREEEDAARQAEEAEKNEKKPPDITDGSSADAPKDFVSGSDIKIKVPIIGKLSRTGKLAEPAMPVTSVSSAENVPLPEVPAVSVHNTDGADKKAAAEQPKKAESDRKTQQSPAQPNKKISDGTEYTAPSIDCLNKPAVQSTTGSLEEMQQGANLLLKTLESFGIKAEVTNIVRGPAVTRYELLPAAGVRISKIEGLEKDIKLRMAAESIRMEAPIPGKTAIGIEVPNSAKSMVTMREIIDTDTYREGSKKSKISVALGKDITGKIITADIAKMPHLLVAGTTGSGKSVCLNSMIISILYNATPDEVKLVMIDPKAVEFTVYNGIAHLATPVVSDKRKAAGALGWAVSEMEKRYKLFTENGVRDIKGFNKLCSVKKDMEKMHQIVIFIDELSDLMMTSPKEVEDSICRLAQMARAAGIHLVVATQSPRVDVITGLIKANIPSRIALKVSQQTESRIILDRGGAEKLLGNGDMLFNPIGASTPTRVQGCFISDEEVEKVVSFIKSQASAEYSDEIEREIEAKAAAAENSKSSARDEDENDTLDPMYNQAAEVVLQAGQASTTMLQKKLKLGYARASRVMDELEETGIVGPSDGAKPRKILISSQEWYERQALGNTPSRNQQMSFNDMSEPAPIAPAPPEYNEYEDYDSGEAAAEDKDGFEDIYSDEDDSETVETQEPPTDDTEAFDELCENENKPLSEPSFPTEKEAEPEFKEPVEVSLNTDETPLPSDDDEPEEIMLDEISQSDEDFSDPDAGDDDFSDIYEADDEDYSDPPVNIDDIFADDADFAGSDK